MKRTRVAAQSFLPFEHEIIVDLFAGGGGASVAMTRALGREPDVAINHSRDAIAVHTVNHPTATHFCEDVYEVDPIKATGGKPVGLLHASPDCTHHSQARGGQPRNTQIRSLSWVVLKWAGKIKPRVITLENVEQILQWGALVAKRDKRTGRVLKIDGSIADFGERVPLREQFLVPCNRRKGRNWNTFVNNLRSLGYTVQWRKLKACDYGAGTSRERLFLMARRDGLPIEWPKPTHGKKRGLKPFVSAADSIDWSIPCPSIFERERPLVDATLRRIAKGIHRYVLSCADPFIVSVAHGDSGGRREYPIDDPLGTLHAANKYGLVVPTLIQRGYGERQGQEPRVPGIENPLGTIVAEGIKHAVVTAHLTKFRGGAVGSAIDEPMPTITAGGAMKRPAGAAHAMGVVSAHLTVFGQNCKGMHPTEPLQTILAGATRYGMVSAFMEQAHKELPGRDAREPLSTIVGKGCTQRVIQAKLSPDAEEGAHRVAAFLRKYYGDMFEGEFATAFIRGVPYVIVDIGLRMLTPPELFRAQGFPADYRFTHGPDGRPISKTVQVRLVGNSVSPPPYEALLRANFQHEMQYEAIA